MTVETTKSNLKPETLSLSERLQAEITLDPKTGTTQRPEDIVAKVLPEGLTIDMIERVDSFKAELVTAGAHALGVISNPAMAENADLTRTTLTLPTSGKNYIGFAYDRSRQVPTRNEDGTTGTREKFGVVTADIVSYGTKNRGEFAKVKSELSEMALAAFGKK